MMDEQDNTILLRSCGHEFRRTDLAAVIEHLQTLDDLIQHHDAATTPLERQGIREDILAMGGEIQCRSRTLRNPFREHFRGLVTGGPLGFSMIIVIICIELFIPGKAPIHTDGATLNPLDII